MKISSLGLCLVIVFATIAKSQSEEAEVPFSFIGATRNEEVRKNLTPSLNGAHTMSLGGVDGYKSGNITDGFGYNRDGIVIMAYALKDSGTFSEPEAMVQLERFCPGYWKTDERSRAKERTRPNGRTDVSKDYNLTFVQYRNDKYIRVTGALVTGHANRLYVES